MTGFHQSLQRRLGLRDCGGEALARALALEALPLLSRVREAPAWSV